MRLHPQLAQYRDSPKQYNNKFRFAYNLMLLSVSDEYQVEWDIDFYLQLDIHTELEAIIERLLYWLGEMSQEKNGGGAPHV